MSQPPLERCPFCDYSLEGLPTEHRCPECGRPFDRRWRVFGGRRYWPLMSGWEKLRFVFDMTIWLGLALFFCVLPLFCFRFAGVAFGVVGAVYVMQIAFGRANEFIAVGPQGITVGNRRLKIARRFPWSDLHRVEVCKLDQLAVHAGDREIHCSIGPKSQIRRCVEYINSYDQPCQHE